MNRGCVIVSGGTHGIGGAISAVLAERGWPVLAFAPAGSGNAIDPECNLPSLQSQIAESGLPITIVDADVTQAADVERVVDTAQRVGSGIAALVNNAAIGPLGTVTDTEPALWDQIMAVNLRGPYLLSRAVIPHMAAAGGGCIVNVGSGAGWGKPNMAAYATSKGGLFALTTAMALDHFEQHIRVNAVVPGGGGILSGMSLMRVGGDVDRLRANAIGTVAGRYTSGEDVANAVAFLLSDEAQAISGTVIDVGCFARQGSSTPLALRNREKK